MNITGIIVHTLHTRYQKTSHYVATCDWMHTTNTHTHTHAKLFSHFCLQMSSTGPVGQSHFFPSKFLDFLIHRLYLVAASMYINRPLSIFHRSQRWLYPQVSEDLHWPYSPGSSNFMLSFHGLLLISCWSWTSMYTSIHVAYISVCSRPLDTCNRHTKS